jgi:hypothetical protein
MILKEFDIVDVAYEPSDSETLCTILRKYYRKGKTERVELKLPKQI